MKADQQSALQTRAINPAAMSSHGTSPSFFNLNFCESLSKVGSSSSRICNANNKLDRIEAILYNVVVEYVMLTVSHLV